MYIYSPQCLYKPRKGKIQSSHVYLSFIFIKGLNRELLYFWLTWVKSLIVYNMEGTRTQEQRCLDKDIEESGATTRMIRRSISKTWPTQPKIPWRSIRWAYQWWFDFDQIRAFLFWERGEVGEDLILSVMRSLLTLDRKLFLPFASCGLL